MLGLVRSADLCCLHSLSPGQKLQMRRTCSFQYGRFFLATPTHPEAKCPFEPQHFLVLLKLLHVNPHEPIDLREGAMVAAAFVQSLCLLAIVRLRRERLSAGGIEKSLPTSKDSAARPYTNILGYFPPLREGVTGVRKGE